MLSNRRSAALTRQPRDFPADEISCAAATGSDVYAGRERSRPCPQGAQWTRVEGFERIRSSYAPRPAYRCTSLSAAALHRLNDGKTERIMQLSEGRPRSLAHRARGGLLVATDRGLYASMAGISFPSSSGIERCASDSRVAAQGKWRRPPATVSSFRPNEATRGRECCRARESAVGLLSMCAASRTIPQAASGLPAPGRGTS